MPTIYIYAFVFAAVLLVADTVFRFITAKTRSRKDVNDRLARLSEGGGVCTLDGRCRLKARMRSAEMAFLADLDRATLAAPGPQGCERAAPRRQRRYDAGPKPARASTSRSATR